MDCSHDEREVLLLRLGVSSGITVHLRSGYLSWGGLTNKGNLTKRGSEEPASPKRKLLLYPRRQQGNALLDSLNFPRIASYRYVAANGYPIALGNLGREPRRRFGNGFLKAAS